jgi:hypothetical protein
MGSSTSQPRKGRTRSTHLAKVGSPANLRWEHRTHLRQAFGSRNARVFLIIVAVVSVAGLIFITL